MATFAITDALLLDAHIKVTHVVEISTQLTSNESSFVFFEVVFYLSKQLESLWKYTVSIMQIIEASFIGYLNRNNTNDLIYILKRLFMRT